MHEVLKFMRENDIFTLINFQYEENESAHRSYCH